MFAMKGAIEKIMSCCLLRVSNMDSYPSTANGYAWSLVNRIDLSGIVLMNLLSRDAQISPDKSVNFPCTNAAFTLSPEPVGFVVLSACVCLHADRCQLARRLSLVCGFCFLRLRSGQALSRTFALQLRLKALLKAGTVPYCWLLTPPPSCLRLVLLIVFLIMNTFRFSYRGLPACALHADRSPHKFTPMPGVHYQLERTAATARCFLLSLWRRRSTASFGLLLWDRI